MLVALGGGIRESSNSKYLDNFCEFYKTMRKLNIPSHYLFTFPLQDVIIQIYMIDCLMVRKSVNCWSTMRYKLRALDYVAQLCNVRRSWSENPCLSPFIAYGKKRNPGKGSNTSPVTADILIKIVEYILEVKVYANLQLTHIEEELKQKWCSFRKNWSNQIRLLWYMLAISF